MNSQRTAKTDKIWTWRDFFGDSDDPPDKSKNAEPEHPASNEQSWRRIQEYMHFVAAASRRGLPS